ncbi:MAG: hypothetical protein PHT12_03315 [Patescibacteria group bacterium]|nr:hypothetical protein [Patescibacteria group bacterium]
MTRRIFATSIALTFAGLLLMAWLGVPRPAAAMIASSPCPGNVCADFLTIGGRRVDYWYTQHVRPDGQFRIRFSLNGTYSSSQLISFIVFQMPSFDSWDKLANPDPTKNATYLPEEGVTLDRTAYERRASSGCATACWVDFVMSVKYSGLAEGEHSFNVYVVQNGASGGRNGIKFYADAGAPSNTDESEIWAAMSGMDYPCADLGGGQPIDNDLNFLPNCQDPKCDGQPGSRTQTWKKCEIPERTCNDAFDNDGDASPDCKDQDCNGRQGYPPMQPPPLPPLADPPAYCQWPNERGAPGSLNGTTPCDDKFDNDADGRTDCVDNREWTPATGEQFYNVYLAASTPGGLAFPSSDANICWRQSSYGCPLREVCTLADNDVATAFDDDVDQSYVHVNYDANPVSGAGCRDYDCAGAPSCPAHENEEVKADGTRVQNDCQCFDGVDNDLDHLIDCADPDCLGAECATLPGRTCYDKEFDLGQKIQLCGNFINNDRAQPIDDDGDGPPNCQDSDCKGKFGNCGPCPKREDFTYAACADGEDNDVNGQADCRDAKCRVGNKIGDLTNAAVCSGAENSPDMCSDGFDNDSNGNADCGDSSCAGQAAWPMYGYLNTHYFCGPENNAAACSDGFDNDADGKIDCQDSDCWGKNGCDAGDWGKAACLTDADRYDPVSGWKYFSEVDPTVGVKTRRIAHVNQADVIDFNGVSDYSSVTIIVGDNTDPAKHYPYADSAGCTLQGADAALFGTTIVPGSAIMIFNKNPGVAVNGFSFSLRCVTPGTPVPARRNYPIGVSVLRMTGDAEYGDLQFGTSLLEATPPTVVRIESEGAVGGSVRVPYGGGFSFRVVADDPGVGDDTTGICRCGLAIDGDYTPTGAFDSATNECLVEPGGQYATWRDDRQSDGTDLPDLAPLSLEMYARDGADNESGWQAAGSLAINVTPIVTPGEELKMVSPKAPFFAGKADTPDRLSFSVGFTTARNDRFGPTCEIYVRDQDGNVKYAAGHGPFGPTATVAAIGGLGNTVRCEGEITAPDEFPTISLTQSGTYHLTVAIADADGDYVESNRQVFYFCPTVPKATDPGSLDTEVEPIDVCHWADLDGDGATEGFFTTLYTPTPQACDNCVNLDNPGQEDADMNGVGDECENLGRCEVDKDIVCTHDSWDFPVCPVNDPNCCNGSNCCPAGDKTDATCCPGPSINPDPLVQPPTDPPTYRDPQACLSDWGLCSWTGEVCFMKNNNLDCPGPGVCSLTGASCKEATMVPAECGECIGEEVCLQLTYPWIQAKQGNVFSGKSIKAREDAPLKNATFCITAKDTIQSFASESCTKTPEEVAQDKYTDLTLPKPRNAYSTPLGRIDIRGLLAGRYGEVITLTPTEFNNSAVFPPADGLQGRVYVVEGDLTVGQPGDPPLVIRNGGPGEPPVSGTGTVVIKNGNLLFNRDVVYEGPNFATSLVSPDQIASLGWIALDQTDSTEPTYGQRGNVLVHKDVQRLDGAIYAGGQAGFYSVAAPDTDSPLPLTVNGLIVARQFHFSRSYKSKERGSEQVLYDGRAVANPPPGFADIAKSLPLFGSAPIIMQ